MFMRRNGFTLIELLVTVGIIAMLAGMFLPTLSKARERGRSTCCLNNLKQVFLAMEMYRPENDGCYPVAAQLPSLHLNNDPRICDVLHSYLRSPEVFRCLSDRTGYYRSEGSSYEWNTMLNGRKKETGSMFMSPATTWMLYDYEDFHGPSRRNFVFLDGHASHLPLAQ